MGRALSFAAVIVAGQLGMKHSELGVTMVSPCYLAAFAVWDWSTLGFAGSLFSAAHPGSSVTPAAALTACES